jgi:hypothetical protein
MNKILMILCFMPQIVFANIFRLSCVTPTTTLHLWTEGEYLISKVRHPYGAEFTPFFKGSVSVFQIPELTLKALRQRELASFQEIQWPLESCRIQAPFKVSCRDGKVIHPVIDTKRAVVLETSIVTTEMVSGVYQALSMSLGLNIRGDFHQLTSDFSLERHCR